MFSLFTATSILLAAASSVSGLAITRRNAPAGYASGYLEDYGTYHTRYIALNCDKKHTTAFFDQCCHPLLATENLTTARPAQCTPAPAASSSASAASPTSTVATPADGEDDENLPYCDEEETTTSAAPAATPTANQAAAAPAADPTAAPAASPSPSPSATESPAAAASPAASPASDASQNAPASNPAPSTSSSDLVQGGHGTFFFQNGVAGACGTVHQDSDFVIAMDSRRYDNGAHCGKQIQIQANGKSVVATVADECPTCDNAESLDLSTGAFKQLADESVGLLEISWRFM